MAYRDSTITQFSGTTNLAAAMPAVQPRDRALAIVSQDTTLSPFTPPSGWVLLLDMEVGGPDSHSHAVYEKKECSGSEGTQTWVSTVASGAQVIIATFSGRSNVAPVTFATPTEDASSNPTPIAVSTASGTPAVGDDVAVLIGLDQTVQTDTWAFSAWSSNLIEREDAANADWCTNGLATLDRVPSGAFGTVTATATRTAGTGNAGYSIAVVALPVDAPLLGPRSVRVSILAGDAEFGYREMLNPKAWF